MKKQLFWMILVVINLSFSVIAAQTSEIGQIIQPDNNESGLRIGVWGGYGYSYHKMTKPVMCDDTLCGRFGESNAESFSTGIIIDYVINNSSSWNQRLVFKLNYASLPGRTNEPGYTFPSLEEDSTRPGEYIKVNRETMHSLKIKYDVLDLSFLYKISIAKTGLYLSAGTSLQYKLQSNLYHSFYIVGANNICFKVSQEGLDKGYRYEDGNKRVVFQDEEIPDANKLRLSLIAGLEYEFELGSFFIVPGIFANYGLTVLRSKKAPCYPEDWYVHAWYAGISFLYEL